VSKNFLIRRESIERTALFPLTEEGSGEQDEN